jgi:hypothetical protein
MNESKTSFTTFIFFPAGDYHIDFLTIPSPSQISGTGEHITGEVFTTFAS